MIKLPIFSSLCISIAMIFCFSNIAKSQNEGIRLNTPQAMDGYVLFETQDQTYLINNCGEIVNTWNVRNTDLHGKLLPNGNLIYIKSSFGSGEIVERDWDGNLVKEIFVPDFQMRFTYEVIKKENGNYLCVGRREFAYSQFEAIGYNLDFVSPYYVDIIVELDGDTGALLWEWNISDHVIQESDSNKPNYGSLSDNPQLINMDAVSRYDWNQQESFMINSFDYNPELELIAISVRKMSEIMIIDQTTTTEEAKGSTGGRYGKGGDILYRWGNPQNYGRGTAEDRMLWFQHNPNWIDEGPHKGKMTVFNNGLNRPGTTFNTRYSGVPIFSLPIDEDGNFILEEGEAFGPKEPEKVYDRTTNSIFYSDYTSGAQALSNGNTFITLGLEDRMIELDTFGRVIWDYEVPNSSYIYRAEKYSKDYSAFEGRDLTPNGFAENPQSNYPCQLKVGLDGTDALVESFNLKSDGFKLQIENLVGGKSDFAIFDLSGKLCLSGKNNPVAYNVDISILNPGMYFVTLINEEKQQQTFKIVVP